MHFLWVDNKEPLVEPQGCGHTAGIWLQANDICEDAEAVLRGGGWDGGQGAAAGPGYLKVFFFWPWLGRETLNARVLMTTPRRCL